MTGRGVRFFSEAENDGYINNGFWDPDSNTININVKSKNPSAQILSHELTHSIENTDSYLQLRSVIFERMKRDGMDIDAEYRKKEMLYNDAGYRLRVEGEIAHEIIAEQIEKRYLTDEASIRSLVSENRTLGQRISEYSGEVEHLGMRNMQYQTITDCLIFQNSFKLGARMMLEVMEE